MKFHELGRPEITKFCIRKVFQTQKEREEEEEVTLHENKSNFFAGCLSFAFYRFHVFYRFVILQVCNDGLARIKGLVFEVTRTRKKLKLLFEKVFKVK